MKSIVFKSRLNQILHDVPCCIPIEFFSFCLTAVKQSSEVLIFVPFSSFCFAQDILPMLIGHEVLSCKALFTRMNLPRQ